MSNNNNNNNNTTNNKSNATASPPSTEDVLNVNVGILGHVDSGKTSLVKTLSTLLSTAALDKSKESRQRGMTLDLGFSCFFLELPEHLQKIYPEKKQLQMTLVDCPGHASLIRTIIGGAQIIDMVLLVVDAYKGWQAQTTECLVLAELTSPHLVVALNKVDMFPEKEREERLKEAEQKVRRRLAKSRFPNALMVGVSACIGGEKVAAATSSSSSTTTTIGSSLAASSSMDGSNTVNPTYNIDILVQTLQKSLPAPKRQPGNSSFYFAIDHCFPIKGMGTVLTGTCLSGSVKVNDTIEFPTLGRLERKIKSMQMFKRKTQQIQQGDRAGICVSSLDSNLLERGICAKPGTVKLLKGAIALVRKIPYFPPGRLKNGSKFHISVGHTTLMATVTFWGARELLEQQKQKQQKEKENQDNANDKEGGEEEEEDRNVDGSALGGDADRAGLPYLKFDWNQDFLQQDHLLESLLDADETASSSPTEGGEPIPATAASAMPSSAASSSSSSNKKDSSLLHWAVLDFQSPVYCPLNSLVIGSRLDHAVENSGVSNAATTSNTSDASSSTTTASSCRLAFCGRLVTPMDPTKDFSRIRWYSPKERRGVISRLGDPHQRQDDGKIVRYEVFGTDLFKKETLLKPFLGMKLVTHPQGDIGELKSAFGTSGKFRIYFPAGTTAREGDVLIMPFKRFVHDAEKKMRQEDLILPKARPGSRVETTKSKNKNNKANANSSGGNSSKNKPEATGQIEKVKGDKLENGKYPQAIVAGFFKPEDDIRERVGQVVKIPSTGEQGAIAGAFGKAGKCKVSFEEGISAEPGSKAELLPKQQQQET